MLKSYNMEVIKDIIELVRQDPKRNATLNKALDRNEILTSSRELNWLTFTVYKEGYYLEFTGTRCSFNIYARDNDGELELMRKPSVLHKLYSEHETTNGWLNW